MNDDKISREALKEAFNEAYAGITFSLIECNDLIDNAPPASNWNPITEGLPKEAFGCMVTVWDTDRRTQEDFETVLPYPVG